MQHNNHDNGEIFLIPYSHLDTQWRWEFPTTINKYLKKTLEESIYMFEKYPGHRFNFTGALRYSMMAEYFPEMFELVKALVKEGRWSLAGTCLDETDALIPSAESMVRNILYGDRWQKKVFGRSSRDYMIPDCFGFPGNMPTIMAHCGIQGFSSQKLTWDSAVGIPFEIGVWMGPDGSEIVSALNPHRYDSPLAIPVHLNRGRLARLKRLGRRNGIWKSFQYYGVGDIGGAPFELSVKQALRSIRRSQRRPQDVRVRQGAADEFFAEITVDEKQRMDRYKGDFLLVNHSAGTLTSATIMKRWNRKNEQMAFAAEAAAVGARHIAGARYPREKIASAWQRVIGSQMHDILPGTSTPTAYQFSQNDEVVALNTWNSILIDSAEAMAPYVPGEGSILLFNPLAEAREGSVLFDVSHREDLEEGPARLIEADGTEHPAQLFIDNDGKMVGAARLPQDPVSWTRYNLQAGEVASSDGPCIRRNDGNWILENSFLRITVNDFGALVSILDLNLNKELLDRPMAYELQREKPTKFPAWNMYWKDRRKPAAHRLEGGEVQILTEGPLRCGLRISREFGKSLFVKDIVLDAESPMAEFTEHIDWFESGYSLKLALNTTMKDSRVTYNWETSRMERDVNHKKQFEVPSRLWVDMSCSDRGFTLVEDSKYGYDHPSADTLRMTLIYTPSTRFFDGFRDQKSHDWGHHTIRYGIRPHDGGWSGCDELARAFNQPVRAFALEGHEIRRAASCSPLLTLSNPDVGVMALKLAEDSDDLIIRLYNRRDVDLLTDVVFSGSLAEAAEVSGLEEDLQAINFDGSRFTAELKANGVAAYRIRFQDSAQHIPADFEALALPMDTPLYSPNSARKTGFYPSELVPSVIPSGTVDFTLHTKEAVQALAAAGQTLEFASGTGRVSLLLAADSRRRAAFSWISSDGEILAAEEHEISPRSGFLGQWETRRWKRRPRHSDKNHRDYAWLNRCIGVEHGFVDRARLEWYSTHTHAEGEDQAYQYGYMYTLRLEVPEGAAALRLPNDKTVKIFAASLSTPAFKVRSSQALTDVFDY